MSTKGCCRLHIYLRTNKTLIHNSLYVFGSGEGGFKPYTFQYNYSSKIFTGRAKPIRIIGDPDKQCPD